MASNSTTDITAVSASTSESVMDDGRGFTTAGTEHQLPSGFKPPSSRRAPTSVSKKNLKQSSSGNSKLRAFVPAPAVAPLSLEDLDLESTLVADQQAFQFSSSGSVEISVSPTRKKGGGGGGGRYLDSSVVRGGNLSSYSRAVNKGRLDPSSSSHMGRSRKSSVLQSVMSRLRTSSVSSTASTASTVDYMDSRSLMKAKLLRKELCKEGPDSDLDTTDLLFTIMNKKYSKEGKRAKLLATLLTFSETDVNQRSPAGMTALHCALRDYDIHSVKVLVAFGANINATNGEGKTPLDLLQPDMQDTSSTSSSVSSNSEPSSPERWPKVRPSVRSARKVARLKCIELLKSIGALGHELAARFSVVEKVQSFPEVPSSSPSLSRHTKQFDEVLDWEAKITQHYSDLERNIQGRLQNTTRAGRDAVFSPDTAISLAVQLQEMTLFQKAGSRVLCLDGGGIRGLVQLEMLSQLELKTGRRITELFDWIIGTSTGGVIALGLVYAKKSLAQLRQLYFRMRDEVFGKVKGAVSFNTAGLERILKKEFTETRCMDDEMYPRVLISAVKKDHINLKLHFFNNCFNDDHCKHWPVWKVARYTCAAPVLFGEADEYVDGGVLANNPSDSGLSRIQSYYRSRGEKLPLSLVVSVGSGKYPMQELGNVDFLFVGGQGWSSLAGTSNLMSLLSYALVEPSVADENCKSRCEEQGVRYFRLTPRLEEVVASGETDLETLVAAILQTKREMERRKEFSDLVLCLHELSEASRRMHTRLNGEDSSDSSVSST